VKDQSVTDEFKLRYMERVLARHVIRHMREHVQITETIHAAPRDSSAFAGSQPPLERLVYFLRDILEYSTRDASLLMGITDAQVTTLLSTARKRVDTYEGPSSEAIEDQNWVYFRWKFADLHSQR
jgi:DNA-directed RNA polymerase specialized sigma24 family protein